MSYRPSHRLFVTKYPGNYECRDFQEIFSPYGVKVNIAIHRNYTFVEYKDKYESLEAIFELNGKPMANGLLLVVEDTSETPQILSKNLNYLHYLITEDDTRRPKTISMQNCYK
jgi:RNA recognition motif-containing protein